MSHPSRFQVLLAVAAGLTFVVSGCSSAPKTSRTNVSTPSAGWMASLKQKLSPRPETATIIEATPTGEPSAKLFVAYGRLEESRKNINKAHEAYTTALNKDPESYEAILGLARLEQLAGRPQAAEQGFLKAKEIAPHTPTVLAAVGQFYADQHRWDEAIALNREAFEKDPTNVEFRYGLARVLTQAGRVEEGLAHFEDALRNSMANSTAAAEYNVGVILHEQGRFAEAEQHLLKATIHDPQMAQAQEWLDVVRRDKARQEAIAAVESTTGRIQQTAARQNAQQATASGVTPAHHVQYQNAQPKVTPQGVQPIPQGNSLR